jgi:hypothetical protein
MQNFYNAIVDTMANNSLVMTAPARRSFNIIARHKGFVFFFGFVLPVKARVRPHKLGVSPPLTYQYKESLGMQIVSNIACL